MGRRNAGWVGVIVLLGLLAWGLGRLFQLRFASGEIYPAYSTRRADPLGSKALFDAWEAMPGVRVARHEALSLRAMSPSGTTLWILGVDAVDLATVEAHDLEEMDQFVVEGGRLVITLQGADATAAKAAGSRTDATEPSAAADAGPDEVLGPPAPPDEERDARVRMVLERVRWKQLQGRWRFDTLLLARSNGVPARARATGDVAGLEPELEWRSALVFTNLSTNWAIAYRCEGAPVVMELRRGRGSVVLATDSYGVSNEGLYRRPAPGYLAWLGGGAGSMIFDETHHGLARTLTLMSFARENRLEGVLVALVLAVLLGVWHRGGGLLPAAGVETGWSEVVAGRDSGTGVVQLIRRHIRAADLPRHCADEWVRAFGGRGSRQTEAARDAIETELAAGRGDVADTYRRIAAKLRDMRWKP